MGLEFIPVEELPKKLRCSKCGSTHVKIYGGKQTEYELEEKNGLKTKENFFNEEWNVVYSVECLECGNRASPNSIKRLFGS